MKHDLDYRKYVIGGIAVVIVIVYTVRLFVLQIMSDDYRKSADSNAFLKKIEYPSRGVISDRNGELLVYNQPAYDIMVVMNEAKDRLDTEGLFHQEDERHQGPQQEPWLFAFHSAVVHGAAIQSGF